LTSRSDAVLLSILKRDRLFIGSALAIIIVAAWAYIVWLALAMRNAQPTMTGIMMPGGTAWSPAHGFFVFTMWTVMMIGMMTPSVAPMIALYSQVARQAHTLGKVFPPASWFTAGYLIAWTLFAAFATAAQYGLERAALLSPMMESTGRYFAGAVLLIAGAYQITPVKNACLVQCRAPLRFIQKHGGFKAGIGGSLRLGLLHGTYCVGCCWALMMLLFAGGVMNVLWISALAIVILAEKVLPGGAWIARGAGVAAVAAGAWLLTGPA
jgi:predicted metal-binding membrane protein